MPINGGGGLVYLGDKLVSGEMRQPYTKGAYRISTSKTVGAASFAQDPSSPTEVVASAADTYQWLWVSLGATTGANGVDGRLLLEVWFGSAGNEVLQTTFAIGYRNASATIGHTVVSCPFLIPSGTRVSYTTRSQRTGQTVTLLTRFGYCDSPVPDQPVGSTVDTGTASGILLNDHASASNWSTWKEIWSSTPEDFQGFHFGAQLNGISTTGQSGTSRFQLGVGAASSEVAFDAEWMTEQTTSENFFMHPGEGPYYIHRLVPAGSRVAMRTYRTQATATGWDVVIHGIPI